MKNLCFTFLPAMSLDLHEIRLSNIRPDLIITTPEKTVCIGWGGLSSQKDIHNNVRI